MPSGFVDRTRPSYIYNIHTRAITTTVLTRVFSSENDRLNIIHYDLSLRTLHHLYSEFRASIHSRWILQQRFNPVYRDPKMAREAHIRGSQIHDRAYNSWNMFWEEECVCKIIYVSQHDVYDKLTRLCSPIPKFIECLMCWWPTVPLIQSCEN